MLGVMADTEPRSTPSGRPTPTETPIADVPGADEAVLAEQPTPVGPEPDQAAPDQAALDQAALDQAALDEVDGPDVETVDDAVFEQAAAKAGLVWLSVGGAPDRPLWTIWHGGALHTVVGGAEQPDPFTRLPQRIVVTVPSKDTRAALLRVPMVAEVVPPGTARWVAAVTDLRAARLNVSVDVDLPEIWATNSSVVKLVLAGLAARSGSVQNIPVTVDVSTVRPRGWRRMRAHLRGSSAAR